ACGVLGCGGRRRVRGGAGSGGRGRGRRVSGGAGGGRASGAPIPGWKTDSSRRANGQAIASRCGTVESSTPRASTRAFRASPLPRSDERRVGKERSGRGWG